MKRPLVGSFSDSHFLGGRGGGGGLSVLRFKEHYNRNNSNYCIYIDRTPTASSQFEMVGLEFVPSERETTRTISVHAQL